MLLTKFTIHIAMSQANHPSSAPPQKKSKAPIIAIVAIICGLLLWQFLPRKVASKNPSAPKKTYSDTVYEVDTWQVVKMGDLAYATSLLGAAGTADTGLDIEGNPSTVTRFSALYEPPLSLGVSDKFIELSWYFAPKTDSNANKKISQTHAKKAHDFATALLGAPAHDTIKSMLTEQGQDFAKSPLTLAKCEHYECKLVIDKQSIAK